MTKPWYRQFWPWFIIALPATVVVAGLSTLYIANRHADDLVVHEYYKDGLAINRQLEKQQRARELGISGTLQIAGTRVRLQLAGAGAATGLTLRLSHPLEADRDLAVPLVPLGDGMYEATLPYTVAARWHWIIDSSDIDAWRLDGVLGPENFTNESAD